MVTILYYLIDILFHFQKLEEKSSGFFVHIFFCLSSLTSNLPLLAILARAKACLIFEETTEISVAPET